MCQELGAHKEHGSPVGRRPVLKPDKCVLVILMELKVAGVCGGLPRTGVFQELCHVTVFEIHQPKGSSPNSVGCPNLLPATSALAQGRREGHFRKRAQQVQREKVGEDIVCVPRMQRRLA